MSSNSEDNEKAKTGFWELLREMGRRLKDEIFLLAFLFALLVTYTAILTPQFPMSIGMTFVGLYLIAVLSYLSIKLKRTSSQVQEQSKEYIKWRISYPSAFQNPHKVLRENLEQRRSPEEIVHFDIGLELINQTTEPIDARVYVKSPTQAVGFIWDEAKEIWKRHFGIIPRKETVEFALDCAETSSIDGERKANFVFHGWYRPHFAFRDFSLRGKIVITYRIHAESERGSPFGKYFDTGLRKIAIPFKDDVEYKRIGD